MASYKTKIARLNALLDAHGICGKCGELYEHMEHEPFALCKCCCSEWYTLTPHMQLVQKLNAEIAELKRGVPASTHAVPATCNDCGKSWTDSIAHANLCVAEMLRQDTKQAPDLHTANADKFFAQEQPQ